MSMKALKSLPGEIRPRLGECLADINDFCGELWTNLCEHTRQSVIVPKKNVITPAHLS